MAERMRPDDVTGTGRSRYTQRMRIPSLDRNGSRRFRTIPARVLLPNLVTLLALGVGLTGIRLAFEGKMELALGAIVFAALLDGIDGRLARLMKGQSRFGAELDSLADFMNFGCAPALILYLWGLNALGNVGWIAAMVFAICGALRLARFNVMVDAPDKPVWADKFFTGVPAPAGAIVVMLPIYVDLLGLGHASELLVALYTLAIGFLMVSQLPVFSGKRVGKRMPREAVLPLIVAMVLFFALLVAYPWQVLSLGTVAYLVCLPLGWVAFKRHSRQDAEASVDAGRARPAEEQPTAASHAIPSDRSEKDNERPPRLN